MVAFEICQSTPDSTKGTTMIEPSSGTSNERPSGRLLLAAAAVGILIVVAGVLLLPEPGPKSESTSRDVKSVAISWLQEPARGVVRYCTGEDVSHSQQQSVIDFNKTGSEVTAKLVETSATADAQHDDYIETLSERAQSECDVVYLDVIYMPEFASKNLLYDMSPFLDENGRGDRFNDDMMTTARYDGRLWGVPKHLDAGLMFYRTDKGLHAPASWQDVLEQGRSRRGERPRLRFQAAGYEGLTVVFLELAYSAGAQPIIKGDRVSLNQPETVEALEWMRRAVGEAVPSGAINQTDKGSLSVFERSRALLMRSWPFAASRIESDARAAERRAQRDPARTGYAALLRRTADNFAAVPLPPWQAGGDSVAVLGGHNVVIARNAANPRAALKLVRFLTSTGQIRQDARNYSLFPVLDAVASDPDITNTNQTLAAIANTTEIKPRPVIANYIAVSKIISKDLNTAIRGKGSAADALAAIEARVRTALEKG